MWNRIQTPNRVGLRVDPTFPSTPRLWKRYFGSRATFSSSVAVLVQPQCPLTLAGSVHQVSAQSEAPSACIVYGSPTQAVRAERARVVGPRSERRYFGRAVDALRRDPGAPIERVALMPPTTDRCIRRCLLPESQCPAESQVARPTRIGAGRCGAAVSVLDCPPEPAICVAGFKLGEVAEWSKAAVLKTAVGVTPPGVRIPSSPQSFNANVSER